MIPPLKTIGQVFTAPVAADINRPRLYRSLRDLHYLENIPFLQRKGLRTAEWTEKPPKRVKKLCYTSFLKSRENPT